MSDRTSAAVAWFLGLLDAVGSGPVGRNATVRQCPAHDDGHPSLSVGQGRDGQVLITCHAGCRYTAVVKALSLHSRYLREPPPVSPTAYAAGFVAVAFPPLSTRSGRSPQSRGYRLDAIHDYGPDHRVLRYRKGTSKQMHWETRRGTVCWEPGLYGTSTSALPLYREPDVRMAVSAGEPVLLVESESSVDALRGWYATTWAGGASSPQIERLRTVLAGYDHLIVVPDHDPPGLAALHTLRIAHLAPRVLLPDPGEDARDLHTRVGPVEFRALINGALRP